VPTSDGPENVGTVPLMNSGSSSLPSHGIYGAGTAWQSWSLNDDMLQSEADSPIADFITAFPTASTGLGIIHAYQVSFTGTDSLHFDVYGTKKGKDVFAPPLWQFLPWVSLDSASCDANGRKVLLATQQLSGPLV